MVSDDPESFADLDGHTGAGYANNPNWDGEIVGQSIDTTFMAAMTGSLTPAEMDALAKAQRQQSQTSPQANASANAAQQQAQKQQEQKAEVGYGETAGLVPERSPGAPANKKSPYDSSTWDPKSTKDLQDARQNIMDISDRNSNVKKSTPSDPNNPIEKQAWNANMDAAKNSKGSLPGKYLFIRQQGKGRQHPKKSAGFGQGKPIHSYGPFRNVGGGDVPRGNRTYIDIYDK